MQISNGGFIGESASISASRPCHVAAGLKRIWIIIIGERAGLRSGIGLTSLNFSGFSSTASNVSAKKAASVEARPVNIEMARVTALPCHIQARRATEAFSNGS